MNVTRARELVSLVELSCGTLSTGERVVFYKIKVKVSMEFRPNGTEQVMLNDFFRRCYGVVKNERPPQRRSSPYEALYEALQGE